MSDFKSKLKTVVGLIITYALTRGIQVGAAIILDKYFKINQNDPLLKEVIKKNAF